MYPTPDQIAYHARACLRYIEREIGEQPTRDARQLAVMLFPNTDERARWALWCADALLDGFTYLSIPDRGEQLVAFRCLLQAREYRGQRNGFLPHPLGDALTTLQNAIESFVATDAPTLSDREVTPLRNAARAAMGGK